MRAPPECHHGRCRDTRARRRCRAAPIRDRGACTCTGKRRAPLRATRARRRSDRCARIDARLRRPIRIHTARASRGSRPRRRRGRAARRRHRCAGAIRRRGHVRRRSSRARRSANRSEAGRSAKAQTVRGSELRASSERLPTAMRPFAEWTAGAVPRIPRRDHSLLRPARQ